LLDALDKAGADAAGQLDVATAWAVVEQVAPREQVTAAAALVDELVPDNYSGEAAMREALAAKYGVVRPFLELLAEALPLQATPAGQDLLREVRRLPDLARRRTSVRPLIRADVVEDVVMPAWRRAVFTNPDQRHRGTAGSVLQAAFTEGVVARTTSSATGLAVPAVFGPVHA
jgi:hypothetical protein